MARNRKLKREQPRKDSKSKRVNFDNERVRKFDKDMEQQDGYKMTDKCNDVNWYAANAELLRAAASVPFTQTTGAKIGWKGATSAEPTVPGVMSVDYVPALGMGTLDAINTAKDQVYSYVVHANSRNTSYDAADLMQLIVAGGQVFAAIAHGIRAYGMMKLFDQQNKYMPNGIINLMGFDYDDLRSNLPSMWFDLNELISRSSQVWIPKNMPFVDRWFWLNSNVYMDSASPKGQYYVFVQQYFLGFGETVFSTGTSLNWMQENGSLVTNNSELATVYSSTNLNKWKTYITMVRGMIDKLVSSQDRGTMMGDILKAYGAENLYAIRPITPDYVVLPTFDQEVLTQIENSTCNTGVPFAYVQYSNGRIGINSDSTTVDVLNNPPDQGILNFHFKEVPTPEQIMVATRLTTLGVVSYTNPETNKVYLAPAACGTEMVVSYRYAIYTAADTVGIADLTTRRNSNGGNITPYDVFIWSTFDWAPWLVWINKPTLPDPLVTDTDYSPTVYTAVGDYDNYTIISKDELLRMHTTALYSEFGVPVL